MKYLINTDKLTLLPTTTANLEVWVDYIDVTLAAGVMTDNTFKPDSQRTLFSTAVEADILTAPGAATICRQPQNVSCRNVHATASNTVQLKLFKGANATLFGPAVTLQAGESLTVNEAGVLFVYDINGGVKTSAATGRLLKTTVLTSGTSFVTQKATTSLFLRMAGGGGGGGGCTSVASAAAAAGGGGAGGYAEKSFAVAPNTAYAYTIGALGAGVSGAAGANGGNTTFVVSGVTVTAFGGTGGPVGTAATTLTARAGGAGGVISTNGDLNSGGEPGSPGVVLIVATPIVASGKGGPSFFGSGGLGLVAVGNGNAASGLGAGGGGAATGASTVRTGGNGTGGVIIVDEYA